VCPIFTALSCARGLRYQPQTGRVTSPPPSEPAISTTVQGRPRPADIHAGAQANVHVGCVLGVGDLLREVRLLQVDGNRLPEGREGGRERGLTIVASTYTQQRCAGKSHINCRNGTRWHPRMALHILLLVKESLPQEARQHRQNPLVRHEDVVLTTQVPLVFVRREFLPQLCDPNDLAWRGSDQLLD
jgi:hypothetical protein